MKSFVRIRTFLKFFTGILLLVHYSGLAIAQAPSNDLCSGATPLNVLPSCTLTSGTLVNATATASVPGTCGNNSSADVWYSFVASTHYPIITINTFGANFKSKIPVIQLLTGSCGSLANIYCLAGTTTSTTLSINTSVNPGGAGLTIGQTYFIRVYMNTATVPTSGTYTFKICLSDASVPANDDCGSPVSLTPSLTCSTTSGNMYATSISSSTVISGSCAGTVTGDMWYTFTAPATNATISLSSIGSSITGAGLELLSGSCTTMYSLACGTTSINASGLITGSAYYVRVYNTGSAPASSTNAGFDICVTYTAPPPPPNDECSGAINLPVNASCSNTTGTVNSATASTGIPVGCASTPVAYDVWYKFTATTSTTTTITISGFGAGFAGTQRLQLFSGSCGSLTSMTCGTTSIAQALTTGTTYYVRVYTTTGPAPTTAGDFSICVSTTSAPPRVGNSYVNITKNTTGGVVQNGDILEIRMTILVNAGTTLYKTRYLDNVPSNTAMLSTSADSIRVITNEGLTYRNYTATNNTNDDAGTYVASPGAGQYNIRLNLGQGSGNMPSAPANNGTTDITGAGNLPSTGRPTGGGGMMFATSFRVQVTGNVGDTIKLNGGQFIYRTSSGGTDLTLSGSPYQILITDPLTLCSNAIGINNASEYGGTFGSGTTLNRTTDLSNPIAGYSFVAASNSQAIGDGQYAIINNTSPIAGTNTYANRKPTCPTPGIPNTLCTNRMFGGYWYIKGDHSGTGNSTGNSPTATGSTGGYMLAVNADYVASEAYRQTLTGLCPNTYYEFSAWFQNICPVCGIDSTGAQFAGTSTSPANGYPGVYPNLSFSLDGVDRYSTGRIDTVGWVKKGFVFLTGPTQTSATLSIRNNAQGGGGNDWVMDDISIATCFPSMSYSPTSTPSVCSGNTITIGDTVRSQFSNYTYYVWQRSQDGGLTWTNITSIQTASPTFNGTQWEYITSYNVPTSATNPSDSGDIYRVYTGTTSSNITNPNCVANDGSAPINLTVMDCGIPLSTNLISFNGKLVADKANLAWSTSKEDEAFQFIIEKSTDQVNFSTAGTLSSNNNFSLTNNYYSFTDPVPVSGKAWYRLVMVNNSGKKKYSRIILLNKDLTSFGFGSVINPFSSELNFDIITAENTKINVDLIDLLGKSVKRKSYSVYNGTNSLSLENTDVLPEGIYTLRVENNGTIITKRVVKRN